MPSAGHSVVSGNRPSPNSERFARPRVLYGPVFSSDLLRRARARHCGVRSDVGCNFGTGDRKRPFDRRQRQQRIFERRKLNESIAIGWNICSNFTLLAKNRHLTNYTTLGGESWSGSTRNSDRPSVDSTLSGLLVVMRTSSRFRPSRRPTHFAANHTGVGIFAVCTKPFERENRNLFHEGMAMPIGVYELCRYDRRLVFLHESHNLD